MSDVVKLKDKSVIKINSIKNALDDKGIYYLELANGQLQVDGINFWATSEKYYDPKAGVKGTGFNAFIKYLKDKNII